MHRRSILLALCVALACGAVVVSGRQVEPRTRPDALSARPGPREFPYRSWEDTHEIWRQRLPVPASPPIVGTEWVGGWLKSKINESAGQGLRHAAEVALPEYATAGFLLRDVHSGLSIEVRLVDARHVHAELSEEFVVYPGGHASGADVLHRVIATGTEDFVAFPSSPRAGEVVYSVTLGERVAGLRLVANTLELIDAGGAPRLRVEPPYLVDAGRKVHAATIALEGCAADRDTAPPWGRAVTSSGASTCEVHIAWNSASVNYPALLDPGWTATGNMATPRFGHTQTPLANGWHLIAGGENATGILQSAEVYDPSTETFATVGNMRFPHKDHSATLLSSGSVLIAGGLETNGPTKRCVIFDPTTGQWTETGNLARARAGHAAFLLPSDRVLIVGGATVANGIDGSTEVWDSTTTQWKPAAALNIPRAGYSWTTLADGTPMLCGGVSGTGATFENTCELYESGAWTLLSGAAAMNHARYRGTLSLLSDGRIIAAGGRDSSGVLSTVEIFNPVTRTWALTSSLSGGPRWRHSAVPLPGAHLLLAGGDDGITDLVGSETFFAGFFAAAGQFAYPGGRKDNTMALVSTHGNVGKVLAVGGRSLSGTILATAELLGVDPNGSLCSTGGTCESGFCVSQICCVDPCVFPSSTFRCPGDCGSPETCGSPAPGGPFGSANCDLALENGCEVNLNTDPNNCSECNTTCPAPANSTATCREGVCGSTCGPGHADCDGDFANGCETSLSTTANCGGCGIACGADATCAANGGSFSCVCKAGFAGDGFTCVDIDECATGTDNCHDGTMTCTNTVGSFFCTCNPGFGDCNGVLADGCEANLTAIPNCGGCGQTCDDGNGCTLDSCQAAQGCLHAPILLTQPGPVQFASSTSIQWPPTADAGHWNVYRGTIPATMLGSRPASSRYDQICFESADALNDGPTTSTDRVDPPRGTAFYYLVTGETGCESLLGEDSSGVTIPNNAPCPTPP